MRERHLQFGGAVLAAAVVLVAAPAAHAHTTPGVGDAVGGFLHPLSGLDHLLALLAAGAWAARLGGRAVWLVPSAFIASAAGGGALAALRLGLPAVELMIVASIVVFGWCVAKSVRPPLGAAVALVGAFALVHGHAHVAEMPHGMSSPGYIAGMLLSTALLAAAGAGAVTLTASRYTVADRAVRWGGAAVAACGLLLALRLT